MGERGRQFALLGALTAALAISLVLGSAERGAADTTDPPACAGKQLCVTITDQDRASRTPDGADHYMTDKVKVFNNGTSSNLVNIVVTIEWVDEPKPGESVSTTSNFETDFSDSNCTPSPTETHALTCTTPKSLRPGEFIEYDPLVFRTATTTVDPDDDEADSTKVIVTAAAKEQTNPTKGGGVTAFVTTSNSTSYEGNPEEDLSTAGDEVSTALATAQVGQQFSELPVPAADAPSRDLFVLSETSDFTCPDGLTCFDGGQQVTTTAPGLSPANLRITYTGDLFAGATEHSIVVVHERTGGSTVTISATCSGEIFFVEPPSSEWDPNGCRRVRITHLPGGIARVEIDVWDIGNGRWIGGG